MIRLARYVWVLIFVATSCSDDLPTISYPLYFPLHVNLYWDYAVNETDILQTMICTQGGLTVKSYQMRVLITDSIQNSAGGYSYILHRYTRESDSQSWSDLDTWSARISENAVIQQEGNTSFVKFTFPFGDSTKWNGNLYNNLPSENYYATSVGKPFTFNNTAYPKTLTVYQSNYDDFFINVDKRSEVYAYNIGLVYKKIDQRTFFLDPCYGEQKVQKGLLFEQSLIGHGKL